MSKESTENVKCLMVLEMIVAACKSFKMCSGNTIFAVGMPQNYDVRKYPTLRMHPTASGRYDLLSPGMFSRDPWLSIVAEHASELMNSFIVQSFMPVAG